MTGITLNVASLDEANLVLKALGKLTLEEGVDIWLRLLEQIFRQVSPPPVTAPTRRRGRPRRNGTEAPVEIVGNVAT